MHIVLWYSIIPKAKYEKRKSFVSKFARKATLSDRRDKQIKPKQ